jgi:hypothetical protein
MTAGEVNEQSAGRFLRPWGFSPLGRMRVRIRRLRRGGFLHVPEQLLDRRLLGVELSDQLGNLLAIFFGHVPCDPSAEFQILCMLAKCRQQETPVWVTTGGRLTFCCAHSSSAASTALSRGAGAGSDATQIRTSLDVSRSTAGLHVCVCASMATEVETQVRRRRDAVENARKSPENDSPPEQKSARRRTMSNSIGTPERRRLAASPLSVPGGA